jgi:glycosyltransferase involved in cell wall biosynthesis
MTAAVFAIPGDINLATGGYAYDRRVMALLPQSGVKAGYLALPGSFPAPTGADIAETERRLAAVPQDSVLLIDGLAYGAMPADAIARARNPIVAVVHHPLCLEAGLTPQRQQRLRELETAALALARRIVVTSPTTAATLAAGFGVLRGKIAVAVPGTDPADRARGTGNPLQLLAVGSVVPRKAFDVLVRALGPLQDRDWRLAIVGPADRDGGALAALRSAMTETGVADRVTMVGSVGTQELAGYYAAADVFVMPSLYEGYGMALAEALARGLPIVCTTGGAAAETVPDSAAIKVAPGDERGLRKALAGILDNTAQRRRLADAAWAAGQKLPRWEDTARIVAGVIKDVAP